MPGPHLFTGLSTLGYPDYADTDTGQMLVAEPGGSYGIRAIDGVALVPPADGRWETAAEDPAGEEGGTPPGFPPAAGPPFPVALGAPMPEPEGGSE